MLFKEFTYKNHSIFYRVVGSGKPVLLLHGFGEDGNIWDHQIDVLKKDHQLFIPDLPGSSRSQLIEDMSIEGMGECISDLIKHEILAPRLRSVEARDIALLGHSMGGYITLAIAEKYPELLHSFGLIHSTAFADSEEKKAGRKKSIEFIKEHGAFGFLKTAIPGLFWGMGSGGWRKGMEQLLEKAKSFSAEALVAYYEAMIARPDRTNVLKEFPGTILFVIGEHDKAIPYTDSLKQCQFPARSHVHIMQESAHMSMLEETEKHNLALSAFFRS